jgi:hypothetical protein
MKNIFFAIVLTLFFAGCEDNETNINYDNIDPDTSVPHPVPTSNSEEFPPHAPNL